MRYIPIDHLTEGMIVGKSLFDKNEQLLLKTGSPVQLLYLDKIKQLGYQGVYIKDAISEDIEIQDIINDLTRMEAIDINKEVTKHLITYHQNPKKHQNEIPKYVKKLQDIATKIVDEILMNNDKIVNMIDLKLNDEYQYLHNVNVSVLSIALGIELGMLKEELVDLGIASMMCDAGKMCLPQEVMNKVGQLTPHEANLVKKHVDFAYEYLRDSYTASARTYIGVLHHHEKHDGTGYPKHKKSNEIPLFSKIIAIADIYDALTSNRPFRKAILPSEAMEYLMANGGSIFDTDLIHKFTRKVAPYPLGIFVRLSNGYSGIVCKNYPDTNLRPVIKAVFDPMFKRMRPKFMDLRNDPELMNVTITSILLK